MRENFHYALPLAIGIRSPIKHTIYIYAQSSHQETCGTEVRQSRGCGRRHGTAHSGRRNARRRGVPYCPAR